MIKLSKLLNRIALHQLDEGAPVKNLLPLGLFVKNIDVLPVGLFTTDMDLLLEGLFTKDNDALLVEILQWIWIYC